MPRFVLVRVQLRGGLDRLTHRHADAVLADAAIGSPMATALARKSS